MKSQLPHITFVIRDVEGGVASMNHQIIDNAGFGRHFNVHVILLRSVEETNKNFRDSFVNADDVIRFQYSQFDNYYFTLKRLNAELNRWPGLIVTNDGVELEAIKLFGTRSTLFSIVHDFYNLKLAVQSLKLVDYFICHTEVFAKTLLSSYSLNDRVGYLLHGVKVSKGQAEKKSPYQGKIRIVSIARLIESKGVLQFAEIDNKLRERGVEAEWKIIGSGELEEQLRLQWAGKENVGFYKPDTQSELLALASEGDIFISPSIFEGYGIALLEAMSRGLVPVIHQLPVGVYSYLPQDAGFSIEMGDLEGFAKSISCLDKDRDLLMSMGNKAKQLIVERFDITKTSNDYLEFFRNNGTPVINRQVPYREMGAFSLLDRPYVPNSLTRFLKRIRAGGHHNEQK
jgi:glycosyltransferase involved in cell wall biosynthesis